MGSAVDGICIVVCNIMEGQLDLNSEKYSWYCVKKPEMTYYKVPQ